jgi:hypothetical protein
MRIAIYGMIAASIVWLGYQFWRLIWLRGYWGAVDLHQRYVEVQDWFGGRKVYGRSETPTYPPASYVLLWPFLGWVTFNQARWIWAVTTIVVLAWFIRLARRESLVRTSQERTLVTLMPLAAYATGATVGNGQLSVHLLPLLVASLLLVAKGPGRWRDDLLAAGLFIPALVKPSFSLPFYLLVLFLPRRIRPAALIAAGYGAITLLACSFQEGSLLDQMRGWQASVEMSLNSYALRFSHENLHIWFASLGLSRWLSAASFLALLALGLWIYFHRHIDVWVLIGVAALVGRLYTYHGWYDDVLLFLPVITLFRIASRNGEVERDATPARVLLGANLLFMIAPGGLYLFPYPLNMIYVAFQTLVWMALLGFLFLHARRAKDADRASLRGCRVLDQADDVRVGLFFQHNHWRSRAALVGQGPHAALSRHLRPS